MNKNYYSIFNSSNQIYDLQGQQRIRSKTFVKVNIFKKYILLPFLSIITYFIILAVIRTFKKLEVLLIYEECQHQQATHLVIVGNHQHLQVTEIFRNQHIKYFYYKKVKFILSQSTFYVADFNIQNSTFLQNQKYIETGLTKAQLQQSLHQYGQNQHIVEIPTLYQYLFEELTNLIIIFQYILCIIIILQKYYTLICINISLLLIILVLNYFILRNGLNKIKKLAEIQINVQVIRDSTQYTINSRQLVLGDIFIPISQLTCDAILIKGQVYVSEAGLTGQSIPIVKLHIKNNEIKEVSRLYEGSKILQSRSKLLAIVVHTGFITRKGRLIRSILFKTEQTPQFQKYLAIFMLELLILCSIMYFCVIKFMVDKEYSIQHYLFRAFDILYYILPIFYPTFLKFCYTSSLHRLRKNDIYCREPSKTIESGKVKIMCFDKTGTLTKNEMKIHSIVSFEKTKQFKQVYTDTIKQNYKNLQMKLFATCHTVRKIQNKFYGDQLDLCMYKYSGYDQIITHDDDIISIFKKNEIQLEVIKVNQFQSKFQSMSVIVKDKVENKHYVFIKGASEKLYNLSLQKPQGFNELIKNISFKGLRSLAFGYKQIYDVEIFLNMERQQLEKDIELLGVVTFENEIKQDAMQTIKILQEVDIDVKMITGDNIYIAIQTAMRCKMFNQETVLIFKGHDQKNEDPNYYGHVISFKNASIKSQNIIINKEEYIDQQLPIAIDNNFLLKNPYSIEKVKIFASITPEYKAIIIKKLKNIITEKWQTKGIWNRYMGNTKQKVGMVGDQSNDIMAIKQSDIGMGINQTQSSLSAIFSISNLIDISYLIRQGKSSLCILIQICRFNMLCNIGRFFAVTILLIDYSIYSDSQFRMLVYLEVFGLTICLLFSDCSKKLSKKIPNDNILSLQYNLAYIFQACSFIICNLVIYCLLFKHPQYIPGIKLNNGWTFQTQANTVIYLSTQLYFSFNLIFVYRSDEWKNKLWKNYLLLVYFILLVVYNALQILIIPLDKTVNKLLDLIPIPNEMRYIIFGITILFIIVGYTIEQLLRKLKDQELI